MNEGTPSTLQTLVRKDGLSKAEWNHVLENLRARIRPFLRTVTLTALGDMRLPGRKKPPKMDGHQIVDDLKDAFWGRDEISFNTVNCLERKGFFFFGETLDLSEEHGSYYFRKFWGIDRGGSWVSGEIRVDNKSSSFSNCGYEKALAIRLQDSNPDDIVSGWYTANVPSIESNYRMMWSLIVKAFDSIVEERKERYEQVLSLKKDLDREHALLRQIPEEAHVIA